MVVGRQGSAHGGSVPRFECIGLLVGVFPW